MSSVGENSEIYVALRSFSGKYNNKNWGNYPPHAGNYHPKGENQSIWKLTIIVSIVITSKDNSYTLPQNAMVRPSSPLR